MLHKRIASLLLIGAFVLSGCVVVSPTTIHGGGKVALSTVQTGLGNGVAPTQATIAVNVNCHKKKDMFRSNINVNDKANGVKFTAHMPWTDVSSVFSGFGGTIPVGSNISCADAANLAATNGYSITPGTIRHKGNKNSGSVTVTVSEPGANPGQCGDMQVIQIDANGSTDVLPGGSYTADGCLERGNIKFK